MAQSNNERLYFDIDFDQKLEFDFDFNFDFGMDLKYDIDPTRNSVIIKGGTLNVFQCKKLK